MLNHFDLFKLISYKNTKIDNDLHFTYLKILSTKYYLFNQILNENTYHLYTIYVF